VGVTDAFQLRVSLTEPARPDAMLLDWSRTQRATIDIGGDLLATRPPSAAIELLRLAGCVYCIDKVVPRARATDAWTRDLSLEVPVVEEEAWRSATPALTDALDFLSGDRWTVAVTPATEGPQKAESEYLMDAVCLFSSGLDSLCGAIDLLEEGASVCLVSHYEGGLTPGRQRELATALRQHYGKDRVRHRSLFLRPAPPRALQARPLPRAVENTTRSRSLLFIAAGLAVASAMGSDVPLHVPENGFIGINVPLTPARSGSLSTRTTHPYFLGRLREALDKLGISNEVVNPFRLHTKGEVVSSSRNPTLLAKLAPRSLSCAHPERARYDKLPQGNCGYCFPCVIRRAAMHRASIDEGGAYTYDVLREVGFVDSDGERPETIRALIRSLRQPMNWTDVIRNGPIPGDERAAFEEVYRRGREELFAWLSTTADPSLRSRLPGTVL
jgi:7-cyano-7-deazaguanine synthase in queuosine biosynthesis